MILLQTKVVYVPLAKSVRIYTPSSRTLKTLESDSDTKAFLHQYPGNKVTKTPKGIIVRKSIDLGSDHHTRRIVNRKIPKHKKCGTVWVGVRSKTRYVLPRLLTPVKRNKRLSSPVIDRSGWIPSNDSKAGRCLQHTMACIMYAISEDIRPMRRCLRREIYATTRLLHNIYANSKTKAPNRRLAKNPSIIGYRLLDRCKIS